MIGLLIIKILIYLIIIAEITIGFCISCRVYYFIII